jgi:hypothetical protein
MDEIGRKISEYEPQIQICAHRLFQNDDQIRDCANRIRIKVAKRIRDGKKILKGNIEDFASWARIDIIRAQTGRKTEMFLLIQKEVLSWEALQECLSKESVKRNKRYAWVRQCLLEGEKEAIYRELKECLKKPSQKRKK